MSTRAKVSLAAGFTVGFLGMRRLPIAGPSPPEVPLHGQSRSTATMLALGVLSTEHLHERRERLRLLYQDAHEYTSNGVLVRFVLSVEWLRECASPSASRWCTGLHANGSLAADEVSVRTVRPRWTRCVRADDRTVVAV